MEGDQRLPWKQDRLDRVAALEPVAVSQSAADIVREARDECDRELIARTDNAISGRVRRPGVTPTAAW